MSLLILTAAHWGSVIPILQVQKQRQSHCPKLHVVWRVQGPNTAPQTPRSVHEAGLSKLYLILTVASGKEWTLTHFI